LGHNLERLFCRTDKHTPPDLTNVVAIAAGGDFSLALQADGSLVAWGKYSLPAPVSNVIAVATGGFANAALTPEGKVINWGKSTWVPTNLNQVTSISVAEGKSGNHGLALKRDGTVAAWGNAPANDNFGYTNVPLGLNNIRAIAAGRYHNLALKSNGVVVSWGRNFNQESSVPFGLTNVIAIAASGSIGHIGIAGGTDPDDFGAFNLALKNDGTVTAWGGRNLYGETNVPAGLNDVMAIAAGGYHGLALRADRTVAAWGINLIGITNVPTDLTNVIAIAAGTAHSLALKSDGRVVAWGDNGYGQTNVPAGLSNVIAIAAGGSQNLALTADLRIHSFGLSNQIPILGFQTFASQEYQVEYASNPSDANWQELSPDPILGNGSVHFVADPIAATNAPARFYRMRRN
jgi:alpha-tubulin suppressor-like RCC1 family protein